ncbi:secretory carrier membrane protein 2, like isoform X2 [Phycodurus eques]|uniref:secretory carrier membrane protein 2, like isoform X2 n=1 Tax=Phycodurus eques TaxID=693459 RepID=UPI002ACDFDDC|nr:secretory carrier membrane protein 2, like isoform X2 [Phycodurus eques]
MSGYDSNPFADPVDVNPFQDASITRATRGVVNGVREYNAFSTTELKDRSDTTIPISAVSSQPAILQTSVEQSSQQASAVAAAGQANLIKQQEELERKAAELERKEQELQNRTSQNTGVNENNWPPLPKFFPVKPCFYQDFEADIPEEYRRLCKRMYYLWMFHSATLFLNVLACLAYFTVDSQYGVDFGLSILWFMLFTPVSFVCWYRPVYKAFSGRVHHPDSGDPQVGQQWLDCIHQHDQHKLGCSRGHDGGGWLFHCQRHPGRLPAENGPLQVQTYRSQLHQSSAGVLQQCPDRQNLPVCCYDSCSGSFWQELTHYTMLFIHFLLH